MEVNSPITTGLHAAGDLHRKQWLDKTLQEYIQNFEDLPEKTMEVDPTNIDAGFSGRLDPILLIRSTLVLHLTLGWNCQWTSLWYSILDTFIDLLVVVLLLHADLCNTLYQKCVHKSFTYNYILTYITTTY